VILVGNAAESFVPIAVAFTAGAFIYIAGSDLVPQLHKTGGFRRNIAQFTAIIIGFFLMTILTLLE